MNAVLFLVRTLFGTLYVAFVFFAMTMSYLYSDVILGMLGIQADGSAGLYLAAAVLVLLICLYLVLPRFGLDRQRER